MSAQDFGMLTLDQGDTPRRVPTNYTAPYPHTRPRILVVGLRQFRRSDSPHPPWIGPWTWLRMTSIPGLTPDRTPMAWRRLVDAGLHFDTAVDLLPPGGPCTDTELAWAAQYLVGVVDGLATDATRGYDLTVLLGGKVANAFRRVDPRLHDMGLLDLCHGHITLPSPHVNESDPDNGWWGNPDKQQRLRDAILGALAVVRDDIGNANAVAGGQRK